MRLDKSNLVDRCCPLNFEFDGQQMTGCKGDTIASALMANGISLVARSFKYHRPRGFFGAGSEEPNAIFTVGLGSQFEPNLVATQIPLQDGMIVKPQNCWPSLKYDLGSLNNILSPILPSGFYYKTFMWPAWAWKYYEHLIRNAAGYGVADDTTDKDLYIKRYAHCDVLVVGGGPSGLKAAEDAIKVGARVIVCDESPQMGGSTLDEANLTSKQISIITKLSRYSEIKMLPMTTAFGWFDHNYVLAVSHTFQSPNAGHPRQTLYKIRAKKVVLATGALERSLLFENNDLPGVMLCSAVKRYINRYGVCPGHKAIIYTNNDSAYELLPILVRAGIGVKAIVDLRKSVPGDFLEMAERNNVKVIINRHIISVNGKGRVRKVKLSGVPQKIFCDLVCVSGGWTPTNHLLSQRGGGLRFNDQFKTLLAKEKEQPDYQLVGAAAGELAFQGKIETDWSFVAQRKGNSKIFLDLQNDVLASDVALAVREGYGNVELVKRYTTIGMGTDQGKTSNINAIGLLSAIRQIPEQAIGHTSFRAPYTPVTLGVMAGRDLGEKLTPTRRTPFHLNHIKAGAIFEPSSSWLYPKYYQKADEKIQESINQEVINTRRNVGMVDMSSLGKFEFCGPDACQFLELTYINTFSNLFVGRCRYGVMLRDDGMILDDGTVTKLADDRYFVTTTTAQTRHTQLHFERLLQINYPHLNVAMLPVTEQWATLAIAGPKARDVLQGLHPNFDVSNTAFPFAHYREGELDGLPVRVFRVSFSGELCFEISIGANFADILWNIVSKVGEKFDIMPYGLEALDIMRIEKGHLNIGTEIDGKTTVDDLGLSGMMKKDSFFIGKPLLDRMALQCPNRLQLIGLKSNDCSLTIPRGALIYDLSGGAKETNSIGHVTATIYSPTLNYPIALALVQGGHNRKINSSLIARSSIEEKSVVVHICSPVFFDPIGERLRV